MKLSKLETLDFNSYTVEVEVTYSRPKKVFGTNLTYGTEEIKSWVPLESVIEADDSTGLTVQQVQSPSGDPVFTNGIDDIFLSNTAKLLLLVPAIEEVFHKAGYKPKLITSYQLPMRITKKVPQDGGRNQST